MSWRHCFPRAVIVVFLLRDDVRYRVQGCGLERERPTLLHWAILPACPHLTLAVIFSRCDDSHFCQLDDLSGAILGYIRQWIIPRLH